ncbi:MAG: 4-hydroxy-tetrahydrodipicolinate synthase [Clostridiales bacterium]|nr:MAG: 4-hydroxy-tetrahydrodipicolinate synthase [Clostridiales bacterium]
MKKEIFRGAATALITPFRDRAVDFEAFGAILDHQLAAGISALVVCGTTGEASTMTEREQIDTVAFAVRHVSGRVPVIAGAGSNNTAHAIELSRECCRVGADALLVVTPYYNKTSQKGLVRMYTEIADSVEKPLILYNVPSRTGVNIEPSTYAALADHPNIAGIKEAGGNFSKIAETVSLIGDKLALYSGNDDQTVPMLALGAAGVISVLSNVLPAETERMCRLFFEGEVKESAKMQCGLIPLISALFSDVNPIPVKEAMAMLGFCTPQMRLPLVGLDEEKREALRHRLKEAGLDPAK